MKDQDEFLRHVAELLDRCQIPYMVAGSVASSFHGEPRATNDVDLVIDPQPANLERLIRSLGAGFYVSDEAAREALRRRSMFNVIDIEGGWKADLIVRKDRDFSVEEFRRRMRAAVAGGELTVATPEDVILTKLEWGKESESERQYRDALRVAALRGTQLDRPYLMRWAAELGVVEMLDRLLAEADPGGQR